MWRYHREEKIILSISVNVPEAVCRRFRSQKAAIKSGGKKVTKKTQMQYDRILEFMEDGKEYGIWDFCELLGLKESRTKDILKGLSDHIEIIGSTRDRRYQKNNLVLFVCLNIYLIKDLKHLLQEQSCKYRESV